MNATNPKSGPLKAFISSTYADLSEHRAYVIKILRQAGIFVDPMEEWTAAVGEPKRLSRERLEGCDLCVLLVAFRRGYVPDGDVLSITQQEYEEANRRRIPVLTFLLREGTRWLHEFYELDRDQELQRWRGELEQSALVGYFGQNADSIELTPALFRWLNERGLFDVESDGIILRFKSDWGDGVIAQFELHRGDSCFEGVSVADGEVWQCDRLARIHPSQPLPG